MTSLEDSARLPHKLLANPLKHKAFDGSLSGPRDSLGRNLGRKSGLRGKSGDQWSLMLGSGR